MRFWSRLLLIVCMLTGLAAAPAMAFGMPCHNGMAKDMSGMPVMTHSAATLEHGKAMHHQGKSLPDKSAFACLIHCLGVSGFAPLRTDFAAPMISAPVIPRIPVEILEGRSLGPPLEPPISRFVFS